MARGKKAATQNGRPTSSATSTPQNKQPTSAARPKRQSAQKAKALMVVDDDPVDPMNEDQVPEDDSYDEDDPAAEEEEDDGDSGGDDDFDDEEENEPQSKKRKSTGAKGQTSSSTGASSRPGVDEFVVFKKDIAGTAQFDIWKMDRGKLIEKFSYCDRTEGNPSGEGETGAVPSSNTSLPSGVLSREQLQNISSDSTLRKSTSFFSSLLFNIPHVAIDINCIVKDRNVEIVEITRQAALSAKEKVGLNVVVKADELPKMRESFEVILFALLHRVYVASRMTDSSLSASEKNALTFLNTKLTAKMSEITENIEWIEGFAAEVDERPEMKVDNVAIEPDTTSPTQCMVCKDCKEVVSTKVTLTGDPYESPTLLPKDPNDTATEYSCCISGSKIVTTYHSLKHFIFFAFTQAKDKMFMKQELPDVPSDQEALITLVKADTDWIDGLFEGLMKHFD